MVWREFQDLFDTSLEAGALDSRSRKSPTHQTKPNVFQYLKCLTAGSFSFQPSMKHRIRDSQQMRVRVHVL